MLIVGDALLLVIDVQGKLASLTFEHEKVIANITRTIKAIELFEIPILWSEQVPDKIGATVPEIHSVLFPLVKPIIKKEFSCWDCREFVTALQKIGRRQILITGIETHVCVYQTAYDLYQHGYDVHVLADAVSSRTQANRDVALARMQKEGMTITSAEMAICELLTTSEHPRFRDIMANIKR